MKQQVIILAMLLALAVITNGQARKTKATSHVQTEQVLRKLEREWLDAYLNKDVAAMRRILADDFTITYGDGSVRDKAETIRSLSLSKKNPEEYHWTEDSKVRVYGDAAIITGRFLYRRAKDQEPNGASRYTDTYVRRKGHWQVVASHLSNITKK